MSNPLAGAKTIVVIDWPSKDVPDSLAKAGLEVHVHGGPEPDNWSVQEAVDEQEVVGRRTGTAPGHAEVVYSYRPLDELDEILDLARQVGAKTVWLQSGKDSGGQPDVRGTWLPDDVRAATRDAVESAGFAYVGERYIGEAARSLARATDDGGWDRPTGDRRDDDAADRDYAGGERDDAGTRRDLDGQERDRAAERRDQRAEERDRAADHRDRRAEERDRAAEERDRRAERAEALGHTETPEVARRQAAEDRDQAAEDRPAGAADRTAAEGDREKALSDRDAGATERILAESDRETALDDRGASAKERDDASIDSLTGVYTRGLGLQELTREMERSFRSGRPLAVGFVDVDGLKRLNDAEGHAAGDRMLAQVATALRSTLRSYDLVFRYGGDEFVCAMSDLTLGEADGRLRLVNEALEQGSESGSVTFGLAELQQRDSAESLISRADQDLYRQKSRPAG